MTFRYIHVVLAGATQWNSALSGEKKGFAVVSFQLKNGVHHFFGQPIIAGGDHAQFWPHTFEFFSGRVEALKELLLDSF